MGYLVVAVVALLLGFGAGFVTVKRSSHWCAVCGFALRCTHCAGQPTWSQARERARSGTPG